MPSLQLGGVTSGLDTEGIIKALLDAERTPLRRLQVARGLLSNQKDAYGRVSSLLSDLLAKSKAFTVDRNASARKATSADAGVFTATAGRSAAVGQYQLIVDRLATPTVATSTAALGTAVTTATWTGAMSTLPLPGSVTAGEVSVVVDGTILAVTVGNPASTSLSTALGAVASAIQTHLQASDPAATVAATVVGNKARLELSGTAGPHTIDFGAGGDSSNLLSVVGLAGRATLSTATPIDGSTSLGVVRTSGALDLAGLTGLTSTTTGKLKINEVEIAYDTTVDSLSSLVTRINASTAGVIASLDRANDKLVLTRRDGGAYALDIVDVSGTLGAALKLAPGTTNAQTLGQTARILVDGRTVVSDTNRVTNAIEGVTIDLLATNVTPKALTVGLDTSVAREAVKAWVASFNALADQLDASTTHAKGQAAGPLERDPRMRGLLLELRGVATRVAGNAAGSLRALADIGVSTGSVNSASGATRRFSLDEAKFDAALARDVDGVARLLQAADGAIQPLVDRVVSLIGATGTGGTIADSRTSIDSRIAVLDGRQVTIERRVEQRRVSLERTYASLERTLTLLNAQGSQIASQTSTFQRDA